MEVELSTMAKRAWEGSPELPIDQFELAIGEWSGMGSDAIATRLYAHARKVAVGLDIPLVKARVKNFIHIEAAGSYHVDGAGAVVISIDPRHCETTIQLCSVLCHEICHHIGDFAGLAIRSDARKNERLTELLMFVCGFGRLVMDGRTGALAHQTSSSNGAGYLSTAEIVFARAWAQHAWESGIRVPKDEAITNKLRKSFHAAVDMPDRERLIAGYRKRFPDKSEHWILDRMLVDLERDRR